MIVPALKPRLSAARPPKEDPKKAPIISQHPHRLFTIPAFDSFSGSFVETNIRFMHVTKVADIPSPFNRRPTTVKPGLGSRNSNNEDGPMRRYPVKLARVPSMIIGMCLNPLSTKYPNNGVRIA